MDNEGQATPFIAGTVLPDDGTARALMSFDLEDRKVSCMAAILQLLLSMKWSTSSSLLFRPLVFSCSTFRPSMGAVRCYSRHWQHGPLKLRLYSRGWESPAHVRRTQPWQRLH